MSARVFVCALNYAIAVNYAHELGLGRAPQDWVFVSRPDVLRGYRGATFYVHPTAGQRSDWNQIDVLIQIAKASA